MATKRERTRAAILDVALELFATRGYEQTSMADIADAAGVVRQTVLNHFPRKDDLVAAWGERRRATLDAIDTGPTARATATVRVANGGRTLIVRGDAQPDTVGIRYDTEHDAIEVQSEGTPLDTFAAATIQQIRIHLGGGNDQLAILLATGGRIPGLRDLRVHLGSGDDLAKIELDDDAILHLWEGAGEDADHGARAGASAAQPLAGKLSRQSAALAPRWRQAARQRPVLPPNRGQKARQNAVNFRQGKPNPAPPLWRTASRHIKFPSDTPAPPGRDLERELRCRISTGTSPHGGATPPISRRSQSTRDCALT